jgi:hypothetical protein
MIATDVLQRKIDALPEPVLDYLYSERAGELNLQVIEKHQLTEKQEEMYFQILRELFVKDLPLERVIIELKGRLELDDAKAKALAIDIAGFRLLPLDKWLADVSAFLRALGADPKTFPSQRVAIARRTVDEAAAEIATSIASAPDDHLHNRLENVVESVLAGVRTEAQATDVLTRPEKIGGVGLEPKEAERVLEEIREESRSVILDQSVQEVEKNEEAPAIAVPAPTKTKDEGLVLTPEDAVELAQFKKTAPSKDIDTMVQEIYFASGLATEDETMAKRVKTVIGNRLRDVRDQMETLEIMTQPKELGGLSMSQDAARALLNTIQSRLRKNEAVAQAKVQTEKAKWVETERVQTAQTEPHPNVDQKTELERLYQSIVIKSKKATANAPAQPAVAAPVVDTKSAAPANLPISASSPVPPDFRAPASPPEPPAPVAARAPLPPPVTIVKPTPAAPTAPSFSATSFAQRPRLEDVKAAPKLTGPVEELRAITIVDFRRLSKDPKEACMKIKDKIDLLGDQSYTRRSEGISAWTASEVTRTYLELMRESLNGTPLLEAISAREAAKKPALTADEFRAVAELSRQMRY